MGQIIAKMGEFFSYSNLKNYFDFILSKFDLNPNLIPGDILKNELIACLPIFLDRLKNEVTHLRADKDLIMITSSPLRNDLTPIPQEIIPILGLFLRKNHRALRIQSLLLLNTLVGDYSESYNLQSTLLQSAINEINPCCRMRIFKPSSSTGKF